MADSSSMTATDGNEPGTTSGSGKAAKRLPELVQQVAQVEIPVLDQAAGVVSVDDDLPVLEETFAEFEKTVPVLGGGAHDPAPAPVMSAAPRCQETSRQTKD